MVVCGRTWKNSLFVGGVSEWECDRRLQREGPVSARRLDFIRTFSIKKAMQRAIKGMKYIG